MRLIIEQLNFILLTKTFIKYYLYFEQKINVIIAKKYF